MEQAEFEALLADSSKVVSGDIEWSNDEDHSPWVEFRVAVASEPGYPLFVKGSYNALARALTFALIHRGNGRIYALDMGKAHKNRDGTRVGEKHKHTWNAGPLRDTHAYVPQDITESVDNPVAVWRQFCLEAKIKHEGTLTKPPPVQMELLP